MEVTVQEAKTNLSKLLRRVEAGETITIRRGREPVAVLSKVKPEVLTDNDNSILVSAASVEVIW